MKKYKVPLIQSTFYKEKEMKEKLCNFILRSKKLSMGKMVEKFENKFAKWQGRKYSVMFNSGSSANLALIQSLLNLGFLKKGDMVGVSGITWSTNVMPLIQLGLTPIPIDVSLETLNINLENIKKTYSKYRFKALFITHVLGFCGDIKEIKNFCRKNKITLLEDVCESYGTEVGRIKLGNFGLAATFSFFVGHQMSTIEGGAVATDNEDLYNMLKLVRAHGWDRNLSEKCQQKLRKKFKVKKFHSKYTFYDLAFNLRPTEIQGYLGLIQINYIDEIIEKREHNFMYLSQLYDNPLFYKFNLNHLTQISNFGFPIVTKDKKLTENLIKFLETKGIEVRPIVSGVISEQPFFKKYVNYKFTLPNCYLITQNGFYFGNNPDMTDNDLEFIIKTFIDFNKKH